MVFWFYGEGEISWMKDQKKDSAGEVGGEIGFSFGFCKNTLYMGFFVGIGKGRFVVDEISPK